MMKSCFSLKKSQDIASVGNVALFNSEVRSYAYNVC